MTAASPIAVRLKNLEVFAPNTKPCPATLLVGPIDLRVATSEHVLVVGPSGCGKTSLLRAIAGLSAHTSGSIELFDKLATDRGKHQLRPEERGIGYLFQGGALWPHMNALKTLTFTLRAGGVPKSERNDRARELLDLVGLDGFDGRKPSELSGGEGQRLALARALCLRPKLLLLDEPLGPLDAPLRTSMLERIDALASEFSLTILHVTHDPAEAVSTATRTLTFARGRLESDEVHA